MGYVKVDDAFLDHPKFLEVGPLAGYLALCAIAWSNRNRTDGLIPAAQVPRLASFDDIATIDGDTREFADPRNLAEDLVLAGLWERVARGYQIHDYLEHQTSAAEIHSVSTARADAGRRGAKARWGDTARVDQPTDGKSMAFAIADGKNGKADGPPMAPTVASAMANREQPAITDGKNGKAVANEWQKEEVRSSKTPTPSELGAAAKRLFVHWQATCRHPGAKFTLDRRRKVEARLREGYTEEQIQQAIDGAARAAFVNDAGKRFDDLELICRSGSKVEDFIGRAGTRPVSSVELGQRLGGPAA